MTEIDSTLDPFVEAEIKEHNASLATLDWSDADMLREMLRLRLVSNLAESERNKDFFTIWRQICESHYAGEESSAYLIDRSMMRPRRGRQARPLWSTPSQGTIHRRSCLCFPARFFLPPSPARCLPRSSPTRAGPFCYRPRSSMVPTELWPAYLPPFDGHAARRQGDGSERLEPDGAAVLIAAALSS
jgi:hypothetical protein